VLRLDDEIVTVPRLSSRPAIVGQPLLDGVLYTLRLTFNSRDRRWYLELGTAPGEPIVRGLRITSGTSLLGALDGDPRLPPGQLYVVDARGTSEPPDRNAWTDWATMYYRPRAVRLAAAGTADEVF
jgi:hypothetical protein